MAARSNADAQARKTKTATEVESTMYLSSMWLWSRGEKGAFGNWFGRRRAVFRESLSNWAVLAR
jgi:hypothetical protein